MSFSKSAFFSLFHPNFVVFQHFGFSFIAAARAEVSFSRAGSVLASFLMFLASFLMFAVFSPSAVFAEQVGSSPESGSTSRLQTAQSAVSTKTYGVTTATSLGDWGTLWNRLVSAALSPFNDAVKGGLQNLTMGGKSTDYPDGIDDYNNGGAIASGTYQGAWTACTSANNYCGTGRSVAEKRDENTQLIWSPAISSSMTWYVANNCTGTSNTCVKLTSNKTGCAAYDDGNWRLPTQKELMQAYIDGSYGNLSSPAGYWSSTTQSGHLGYAWFVGLSDGTTYSLTKTSSYYVRCVR